MKGTHAYILVLITAALLLTACGRKPKGVDNPQPSVYYWRTTFSLDSVERSFLADAHVGKMYVHFFPTWARCMCTSLTLSRVKGQGARARRMP